MKVRCYSVRLKSLTDISLKCLKGEDWQGNTALIPKSQFYGQDYNVIKSDAYWVSAWLVEKEDFGLMVSMKKQATFDSVTGKEVPTWTIEKHEPIKIEPLENNTIKELKR
jgi:hypothetical protein